MSKPKPLPNGEYIVVYDYRADMHKSVVFWSYFMFAKTYFRHDNKFVMILDKEYVK